MSGTAVRLSKAPRRAGLASALAQSSYGQKARRNLSAYGFLIGAVACFAFFSWYPIVREILMSFQKTQLGVTTWDGWANYHRIFADPTFWQAWRNTLEFTVLALILGYAVPFFVAILLNELRHARGYLRVLVYLPVMLPPASALLLFAYFYDPTS
jgi:multiple sugar transport system permease protein